VPQSDSSAFIPREAVSKEFLTPLEFEWKNPNIAEREQFVLSVEDSK